MSVYSTQHPKFTEYKDLRHVTSSIDTVAIILVVNAAYKKSRSTFLIMEGN
jgi:hypothetical protein